MTTYAKNWTTGDYFMMGALGALVVGLGLRLRTKVAFLGGPWRIVDMTKHAKLTAKAQRQTRMRDPGSVTGAVLHQMSFSRGNDPMRYRRVTANYIVLPDGGIYLLHHWGTRLPASNGLNSKTVGIEFAGNLPSRSRSTNARHFWNPSKMGMDQLTVPQAAAGRYLLRELQRLGINEVFGHVQSNDGKGADPGPDIWGAVASYGIRSLGMSSDAHLHRIGQPRGPGSALPPGTPGGAGKQIPDHWWEAAEDWDAILAAA